MAEQDEVKSKKQSEKKKIVLVPDSKIDSLNAKLALVEDRNDNLLAEASMLNEAITERDRKIEELTKEKESIFISQGTLLRDAIIGPMNKFGFKLESNDVINIDKDWLNPLYALVEDKDDKIQKTGAEAKTWFWLFICVSILFGIAVMVLLINK